MRPSWNFGAFYPITANVLLITLVAFIGTAIFFFFFARQPLGLSTHSPNETATRPEVDDQHNTPHEGSPAPQSSPFWWWLWYPRN